MANKKLTDLTELTTPADGDFLYIIDVSDTTESAQGTSKKIRKSNITPIISGKEDVSNKQNDLTPDGTGTKYPTVDAVNAGLPVNYSKIVYVNATSPITATIFDTENPPVTNDNLLKNDVANLYIGADASTWVYNSSTYVTKTVTATSSNFYLAGTTTDAGNTKTGHITRSGAVTLTGPLNILNLKISSTPVTSVGSPDILTRNPSTTALEKISSTTLGNWTYSGGLIYPKSLTDKVVIGTNSEGLGIPFTVKAFSGGNSMAYFYNNTGTLISKIDTGGVSSNILTASSYILSPQLNLNGYNGGMFGPGAVSQIKLLSGETWDIKGKLKYNVDYSSTYDARTLVDKGYTDSKITQTITNGVTTTAPSEDAVYDAIDGVVKTIISDTPTSTNTGGVSEVLMHTYTIAGGKLPTICNPNLKIRVSKSGTLGTYTLRVKVNSTNNFSTATTIATYSGAANTNAYLLTRNPILIGGNMDLPISGTASSITDETVFATAFPSISYDPSVTQYWFISLQNSDSTDTTRVRSIKLVN